MKHIVLSLLLTMPATVQAQTMIGSAKAIDGDTLSLGGERIRLYGIDAVEAQQTCTKSGASWTCGQEATALLRRMVDGKPVTCQQRDVDAYGRIVATCEAAGLDLARVMVEAGLAVALPQFSDAYVDTESKVRKFSIGIWGSEFDTPAAYRAAHPREFGSPRASKAALPVRRSTPSTVYFFSCRQAWAAGAAPIYYGQPGYRPQLDGDGDGVACEPFRGRR